MSKFYATVLFCVILFLADGQSIKYITQGGAGLKDGSNWTNAGDSSMVQSFIDAANTGDSIWVAKGTYRPNAYPAGCTNCSGPRDYTFMMRNGVSLFGGFDGTETTPAQRNISANPTILNGDYYRTTTNTDNCHHVLVFYNINGTDTTFIDGLTITKGYADGSKLGLNTYPDSINGSYGGGIYMFNSKPFFRNCTVSSNSATIRGGGVYIGEGSVPWFYNCVISSNSKPTSSTSSGGGGAGICSDSTALTIIYDCIISNNSGGNDGGGIFNRKGGVFCYSSVIASNTTTGAGGGLSGLSSSEFSLFNCVIVGNTANSWGGGIECRACTGSVYGCTFAINDIANTYANNINSSYNGSVTVHNTILWYDDSGNIPAPGVYSVNEIIGYPGSIDVSACNVIQNYLAQPSPFVNLNQVRGPDNLWRTADDGLQITCTSAAYNSGYCDIFFPVDVLDTLRDNYITYDIGAYELPYNTTPPVLDSFTSVTDTICYNARWEFQPYYHNTTNATVYYSINNGTWHQLILGPLWSALQTGDSVQCKIVSNDPCHIGTIYTEWKKVTLADTVTLSIGVAVHVCEGDTTTLSADFSNIINPTFVWSRIGNPNVGTGPSLIVADSGLIDYTVRMTGTNLCTVQTTWTKTITRLNWGHERPSAPLIQWDSINGTFDTSFGWPELDWYCNGVFVGQGIGSFEYYRPTVSGCYYALTNDPNESSYCTSYPSNTICITITGISEIPEEKIFLFPNPAKNRLFILSNGATVTEINIYSTTGGLVSQTNQPQNNSIDISQLADRVYIAEIKTKELSVRRRWVKM